MSDAAPVFIGLDTTAGKHPITLAILNASLNVLHCDALPIDDALTMIASYPHAICGIDAPIEHSRSLLADPNLRQRLGLDPNQQNYATYRVCEFELRRRGIHSYKTPLDRKKAPKWMKISWKVYQRMAEIGFSVYPNGGARVMFETYPHAAYTMIIGKRPYPKESLEGRMQRQLLLLREGVRVKDAMDIFEEWTRHRFTVGELPLEELYEHDALDALIAAYTACLLYREPQNVTAIGDPGDGQIIVPIPVTDLLQTYP